MVEALFLSAGMKICSVSINKKKEKDVADSTEFDLLIKDIDIADGTGKKIFKGSVGIKNGKIVRVSENCSGTAASVRSGKPEEILAPGFIDTHTHSDLQYIADPYVRTQLLQGVTFSICGNCGVSAAPVNPETFEILRDCSLPILPFPELEEEWKTWTSFKSYINSIKEHGSIYNTGALVGHGTLRIAVMGVDNRKPTSAELEKMKSLLSEALNDGALGLSSGLVYVPSVYSDTEEMIELCKVVAAHNGFYSTHMRSESSHIIEAVKESIQVAEASKCKLVISHLKTAVPEGEKIADEIFSLIINARERGVKVICDQYLSNKGSTTLAQLIPPKYQSEGIKPLLENLRNPETKKEIISVMKDVSAYENYLQSLGADKIIVVANNKYPEFNGLSIAEISTKLGTEKEETVCRLLLENNGNVLMAVIMCSQESVDKICRFPLAAIGSDGIGAGTDKKTHPRAYGNFVHYFEDYVRNRKIISWEEAVRKATSLPADFLNLKNKGHIEENYDADIVIFDRNEIGTDSSFAQPNLPPKGIRNVYLKGVEFVKDGHLVVQ